MKPETQKLFNLWPIQLQRTLAIRKSWKVGILLEVLSVLVVLSVLKCLLLFATGVPGSVSQPWQALKKIKRVKSLNVGSFKFKSQPTWIKIIFGFSLSPGQLSGIKGACMILLKLSSSHSSPYSKSTKLNLTYLRDEWGDSPYIW